MNDKAGTSVSGAQYGIEADGLSGGTGNVAVNVGANASITGTSIYGIEAVNLDVGNVSVSTAAGDVINSGSTGIDVVNLSTSILPTATMSLMVTANGTINSGTGLDTQGDAPSGISAGYAGTGVDDNVTVNSDATIVAAAGAGINAYNAGIGDVTVTTGVDSSITAPGNSIQAGALGGGNVSITNDGTTSGGIYASAIDSGTVSVTNNGTVSGSTGLFATNQTGDISIVNNEKITGTVYTGIDVEQGGAGATGSATITNTGTVLGPTGLSAIGINGNATGTATIDNSGTIGPSVASASISAISMTGGDITINNTDEITGALHLANGTFNNESGGIWNATGSSVFGVQSTTGVVEAFTIDNAGTIDLTGGATLSDAHGLVIGNSGTIDSLSGVNIISDAAITNTGTFEVFAGSGLTLDLGSSVANTGHTVTVDGAVTGAVPVAAATLLLEDGTSITSGTLSLGSGSTLDVEHGASGPGATLDGVTVTGTDANTGADPATPASTIEVGGAGAATLTLDDGASITGGTLSIGIHGVLDAVHGTTGGAVTLDDISVTNAGLLEASGGGTLHLDASVTNNGILEANGGTLVIGADASIGGTADITITDGGVAEFAGISAQGQPQTLMLNASFSGSGTLQLEDSQHYGGTVSGFVAGDTIDLTDLAYSANETDVWHGDTLTITSGSQSASITFSGSYGQNSFALTSDIHGDTEVVLSPAQAALGPLDSAGNAVQGTALTATLADQNAHDISYQWLDKGVGITGANDASYTPTSADLGKALDIVVSYTDGGVTEHVTALAGTVAAAPEVSFNSGDVSTDENAPLSLNALSVTFPDAGSDILTVTLDATSGSLSFANTEVVSNNGSAAVTLSGTLSAIDSALAGVTYTPDLGFVGADTVSFAASDGAFHSNTATLDVNVFAPPDFTSLTLTIAQSATEVLSDANFSITDAATSHFTYTVSDLSGGQFDVFNTANSTWTASTGFTTAQVEAGQVEFVQDGSRTAPNFSIFASDGIDHSATIAPTVDFTPTQTLAPANLIVNGGFETDDFSGWKIGGDTSSDSPVVTPNLIEAPGDAPHTGVHEALFGGELDDGTLSQTVATTDGEHYTVDFWVMQDRPLNNIGNVFSASWNGTTLMSLVDVGQQSSYTEYQFDVTGAAGSVSSTLEFSGASGDGYWVVDDVSVLHGAPNTIQQISDETMAVSGVTATDTLTVTPKTQNDLGTVTATAGNGTVEWQFAATRRPARPSVGNDPELYGDRREQSGGFAEACGFDRRQRQRHVRGQPRRRRRHHVEFLDPDERPGPIRRRHHRAQPIQRHHQYQQPADPSRRRQPGQRRSRSRRPRQHHLPGDECRLASGQRREHLPGFAVG